MNNELSSKIRRNDKKDRLVMAADQLIYEQTFHNTTLADIAKMAEVPLGNVYYYFKTKDDIMLAVLTHRSKQQQQLFTTWGTLPTVEERLKAMLQHYINQAETIALHGCATGSLSQELSKDNNSPLAAMAAKLLQDTIKWVQTQFESIGKGNDAAVLAAHWVSSLEGIMLITLTFKQPNLIAQQSAVLENWLKTFVLEDESVVA